jgi:hypothetical protein
MNCVLSSRNWINVDAVTEETRQYCCVMRNGKVVPVLGQAPRYEDSALDGGE